MAIVQELYFFGIIFATAFVTAFARETDSASAAQLLRFALLSGCVACAAVAFVDGVLQQQGITVSPRIYFGLAITVGLVGHAKRIEYVDSAANNLSEIVKTGWRWIWRKPKDGGE